jgi:hypothetical protein
MAFRLTKEELKTHDDLVLALTETANKLHETVAQFNAMMTEAWSAVEQMQNRYNEQVQHAQKFVDAVYASRHDEYDNKSEKWQDSDDGQSVYLWLEEWNITLEESDLELPETIEVIGLSVSDLEELPTEA